VVKSIVYCDFPEKWPGLLELVYNNLSSQVGHKMKAAAALDYAWLHLLMSAS
jgi:hypothetical protein